MKDLLQDLRYGWRVLAARPAFTGVAVLVLALGIGANSAVFTLVNELLLRPLPAEQAPGELLGVYSRDDSRPDRYRAFSYPNYVDVREGTPAFSHVLAQGVSLAGLTEGDTTRRVVALAVSANFFETLGARLGAGRGFSKAEERPGSQSFVAVVSDGYWRQHGRDPAVIGSFVRLNGRDYTVVGVTPEGFTGSVALIAPEVYVPLSAYELLANAFVRESAGGMRLASRESHSLLLAGRLRPGVSALDADAQLAVLSRRLAAAYPSANHDQTIVARPLTRVGFSTAPERDGPLYAVFGLLQAMSGMVLLIACLNLANMLMAQAGARRREMGIRMALGAGRPRIVRQLLAEGLLLALAGGVAGLALAFWATRAIAAAIVGVFPIGVEYTGRPDLRVLGATLTFAAASTMMFGLWPAWRLSKTDVVAELKHVVGQQAEGRRRWLTMRHALVVGQIALSLALLTAGGLFVRSAGDAAAADPGFEFRDGIVASLDPGLAGYDEARVRDVYRRLLERVRARPDVRAAAVASLLPYGEIRESERVRRAGGDADNEAVSAISNVVGADYFASLGLRVLRGREFGPAEEQSSAGAPVVLIDEPLARRLFPDEDPLGQQIVLVGRDDLPQGLPAEVVGVVPGLRHDLHDRAPVAHVYIPFGQRYRSGMTLHAKLAGGGSDVERAALAAIRDTLRAVDAHVPVLALKTLEQHRETSLALWFVRAGARMFSTFALLALFLAVVGIYGLKAYLVTLRTREIGVRMALGAAPREVLWMVLRDALVLTAAGVVLGLALAALVALAVAGLIYQASPFDPAVFAGAVALLAAATLGATYLPARRAMQIEPFAALRVE